MRCTSEWVNATRLNARPPAHAPVARTHAQTADRASTLVSLAGGAGSEPARARPTRRKPNGSKTTSQPASQPATHNTPTHIHTRSRGRHFRRTMDGRRCPGQNAVPYPRLERVNSTYHRMRAVRMIRPTPDDGGGDYATSSGTEFPVTCAPAHLGYACTYPSTTDPPFA